MIARTILAAVALVVAVVTLRCRLGVHRYRWTFVGSSWQPDLYVRACTRCGREPR